MASSAWADGGLYRSPGCSVLDPAGSRSVAGVVDARRARGRSFVPLLFSTLAFSSLPLQQDGAQPLHAEAIEHSDSYRTRAKIHKYASFATLPLFAAKSPWGSRCTTPRKRGSKRGLHAAIGSAIVGLFGVNTVTGAWNMFGEGWHDREGRTLRLVHGLLMMAADVGFSRGGHRTQERGPRGALTFESDKVTHRNIAIASMSVGTAGYLLMLLSNH